MSYRWLGNHKTVVGLLLGEVVAILTSSLAQQGKERFDFARLADRAGT